MAVRVAVAAVLVRSVRDGVNVAGAVPAMPATALVGVATIVVSVAVASMVMHAESP